MTLVSNADVNGRDGDRPDDDAHGEAPVGGEDGAVDDAHGEAPVGGEDGVDETATAAEPGEQDHQEAQQWSGAADVAGPVEPAWQGRDVVEVVRRALAVLVLLPAIGYGIGALRGESHVSRSEFVYSLDGSIPDGFLREDRRLLTQIVTFSSDAVLGPVADEFDLEVDELRPKIEVETVELSEVLRLEVSDADPTRAMELNRAVLEHYLAVANGRETTVFSQALAERRTDLAADVAAAVAAAADDAAEATALSGREQQVERRLVLIDNRIDRLRALQDEALVGSAAASPATVASALDAANTELVEAEAELTEIRLARDAIEARIGSGSPAGQALQRLQADLAAVDAELARRELAPVVGSGLRRLSEPTLLTRGRHVAGLQGMAVGMLLALPVAAYVGYRVRRRQLWLG